VFDVWADPSETTDLASARPELTQEVPAAAAADDDDDHDPDHDDDDDDDNRDDFGADNADDDDSCWQPSTRTGARTRLNSTGR
jgi:hypothetical protein